MVPANRPPVPLNEPRRSGPAHRSVSEGEHRNSGWCGQVAQRPTRPDISVLARSARRGRGTARRTVLPGLCGCQRNGADSDGCVLAGLRGCRFRTRPRRLPIAERSCSSGLVADSDWSSRHVGGCSTGSPLGASFRPVRLKARGLGTGLPHSSAWSGLALDLRGTPVRKQRRENLAGDFGRHGAEMNTSVVQGFDIGPDPHEAIILGNDHSGAGVETKMFFDRIRKGDRVGSGVIACR